MNVQETVVQFFLDKSRLNSYYHEDKLPERSPLVVFANTAPESNWALNKFGKPVVVVNEKPQDNKSAYLDISLVRLSDESFRIIYSYPVEGVKGFMDIRLQNGKLQTIKEELGEN